ncbi:hypothetical protein EC80566_1057, partial [Escherichia coli 8.0566]
VPVLLERALI